MSYKALSEKYAKIILALEAERENTAMIMAHDAHALTAARIQEKGQDWKGSQMPLYSKKPMPYWKINPGAFTAPGKVKKFKDDAAAGKIEPSYHEFRRSYGLPVSKRTLTFDGAMFKDIKPKVTKKEKTSVEVTISAQAKEQQDKVKANSRIVGENILRFGEDEKKLIRKLNEQRIQKAYNSVK